MPATVGGNTHFDKFGAVTFGNSGEFKMATSGTNNPAATNKGDYYFIVKVSVANYEDKYVAFKHTIK